jgi:hypothetical protein
VQVTAELQTGQERDDAWNRVIELSPGYSPYTAKTDRELPIFRMTAV